MRNYRVTKGKTPSGKEVYCGSETEEQMQLIQWAEYQTGRYPELAMLYHVPNEGKRSTGEGGKLKKMGLKKGVPDLVLPVPRGGYAGMYLEMKVPGGRATSDQKYWLEKLKGQGYYTAVCYGGKEAAEQLEKYMTQEQTILVTESIIKKMYERKGNHEDNSNH